MKNDVTLADIAQKLGISSVTVSKALSGKSGVSDELREDIIQLADEMGYVAKEKSHSTKRNTVIGVIVAERYLDLPQSFYWRVFRELSVQSNEKKIFTLLEVVNRPSEEGMIIPNLIIQNNVDGIIVLGAFDIGYLRMLKKEAKVPLLSLDSVYQEIPGDAVVTDNVLGGYEITDYLFGKGHTKIGFVGTLNVTPSIDERYFGMFKYLSASGIPVEYGKKPVVIDDRDVRGNIGADGTFELPEKKEMPTAFFCNCDVTALALIDRLKSKGYRVPEDISVIGFDNYVADIKTDIKLASYEMDIKEMAWKSIKLMTKRIRNQDIPYGSAMIRGRLVDGESVKDISSN